MGSSAVRSGAVYFGDGATSQGDVNEAFVWDSVFNWPILYFCQNNQWAISEPLEKQSAQPGEDEPDDQAPGRTR